MIFGQWKTPHPPLRGTFSRKGKRAPAMQNEASPSLREKVL